VVPRDTVYVDASEGGRVERVLVEPGDLVEAGQLLVELTNSNLAAQVAQTEAQIGQSISQSQTLQLQLENSHNQNLLALEQIDYQIARLKLSAERRQALAKSGAASAEVRDNVVLDLEHYQRQRPIQLEINRRQDEQVAEILPPLKDMVAKLRENLAITHARLDALKVKAPVTGRVTSIDLKVGETKTQGQRLAEVVPDTGIKLSAEVDEFYLGRVKTGQKATLQVAGTGTDSKLTVARVYPQVKNGTFTVDLAFSEGVPAGLLPGQAMQGKLALGDDHPALVLPAGAFLERTGGDWIFVMDESGDSAHRRRIKVGRRNAEQVEVTGGLAAGDRVIVSDYTGLDRIDRVDLSK
jgi:HlyD family secretion protein